MHLLVYNVSVIIIFFGNLDESLNFIHTHKNTHNLFHTYNCLPLSPSNEFHREAEATISYVYLIDRSVSIWICDNIFDITL